MSECYEMQLEFQNPSGMKKKQTKITEPTMNLACARKGEKKIESCHTANIALWKIAELDWYYNTGAQNKRRINKQNKIF